MGFLIHSHIRSHVRYQNQVRPQQYPDAHCLHHVLLTYFHSGNASLLHSHPHKMMSDIHNIPIRTSRYASLFSVRPEVQPHPESQERSHQVPVLCSLHNLMGSDPASLAFDTLQSAKANGADVVLIDTAGRLHMFYAFTKGTMNSGSFKRDHNIYGGGNRACYVGLLSAWLGWS